MIIKSTAFCPLGREKVHSVRGKRRLAEIFLKKTKKLLKKGLTSGLGGGIMGELSSRDGSERSLKIEQQEKKYKAKASMEISLILEENTTQQK